MMSCFQGNSVIMFGFILWIWFPTAILGFNVDTKNMNVISGPTGTLFGFSATFLPGNVNGGKLGMYVGAPNATTGAGGLRSGVLHVCENVLDKSEKCLIQRYFDDALPMVNGTIDEEFGATIAMTKSGKFMVCSPNWKDTEIPNYHFLPGRCTLSDVNGSEAETEQFRPFYHTTNGKQKYYIVKISGKDEYFEGLATFGFSADSDQTSIFVFGAPGVLMSEGTVTILNVNTRNSSRAYSPMVNKLSSTAYGYLGYSVKIGRFCDGADICFAAGAPSRNRVGMVNLYKWVNQQNLTLYQMLEESQAWSYFGYSLCAVDTDKDGYDELLVGAPHYTDIPGKLLGYDQGRVFVYSRSNAAETLVQIGIMDGSRQMFARFGSAIQNIGDINLDLYNDVAVGAPGEDEGAGCIYIYLGGPAGQAFTPSQRITAKQVSHGLQSQINGLGFAFSDHIIPHKQGYPIFAATSVVSDTVVVFKSRPIVEVEAKMTPDSNPVDAEKVCTEPGVAGVCFIINMCMKYQLRGGGSATLTFQIGLDMDVQLRSTFKRALFRLNNGSLVESFPDFKKQIKANDDFDCTKLVAVLRDNQVNQDRFTPVEIVAKYRLIDDSTVDVNPVLDVMKPNNFSLIVTFLNKCGEDNICKVDLSVTGSLSYKHTKGNWNSIVVNDTDKLWVNVGVKNSNETSYWTVVKIEIDFALRYSRSMSDVALNCKHDSQGLDPANAASAVPIKQDKTMVLCNLYKPLNEDASFSLQVELEAKQIELTKKTLIITAEALPKNINNPEQTEHDNIITMTTDVDIIADLIIYGTASPSEETVFEGQKISESNENNVRTTGKEVIPLNVVHKILFQNSGPSFLPKTKVFVIVPMYLLDRTELVNEASVKMGTFDGRVTECNATNPFNYHQQTTSSTAQTYTTVPTNTDMAEFTEVTSSILPEETTTPFFSGGIINRRKRASEDKETQNTIYTLNCNADICQKFQCEIDTNIPSGSITEINVTLVIDKANIPMPENYDAFHYIVETYVDDPIHPLFRRWNERPTVTTITKFHLVQSGGKVNIWIIIGCVIAGLVLITIIVLIFWKLGFFKRDKHKQVEKWKRESMRPTRSKYSKAPTEDANMAGSTPADADS